MRMKFPYELSEQRISLLSKEDQRIYRFEHSDFFDYNTKQRCMQEYQNALLERQGYYVQEIKKDPQFNYLNESEVFETANELTLYETNQFIDELGDIIETAILEGIYTEDEATEVITEIVNNMQDFGKRTLNERLADTPGPDMTWWAEGIGGLFTGLFGLFLVLIMKGKTRAAIKMLENSMNKIVETVDDGVNKKKGRGLWARIKVGVGKLFKKDWSGKNEGEQNTICLRTLQENFSAGIATTSMVLCKKLGVLPDDWNQAVIAMQQNNYQLGDLATLFDANIAKPVNELSRLKEEK